MCIAIDKFPLYAFRSSKMVTWNQPASKDTFAQQYQAFIKDAFFYLDTSISSKRLADDGFSLDYHAIERLRRLNFTPTDEADKLSVERATDLNVLHKAVMGAIEKIMKVYGPPGLHLRALTIWQKRSKG